MPTSDQRTRHLLGILAKENSKTGQYQASPAKFRETALDTHKTMPAEYFGPSPDLLPQNFKGPPDYLSLLKTKASTRGRSLSATRLKASGRGELPPDQIEYRSVFKPRPEQEHHCSLARAHREKVMNSEWALMDTLEIELYNNERDWRTKMKATAAAEQKAYLDNQVRAQQVKLEHDAIMKAREEELTKRETEIAQHEQLAKEQAHRERNVQLKKERLNMLQEARQAKQQAKAAKQQDEAQTLADIQSRLELERQYAAAKAETMKQEALTARLDNEARIRARKEAEAQQKRLDEEMMQAGFRLAEQKETEREESNRAFKAMIEARARGAGQQALDDRRDRVEREDRLMRQFEEQKEREAKWKEERAALKRARQKQELLQAREDFLALKEQRATAAREEVMIMKEVVDAKTRAEMEAEDRKMAGIRARTKSNEQFLTTQMMDKDQRNVDEYVGMTHAERQMNHRLLKQAVKMVGPTPKQITVKW